MAGNDILVLGFTSTFPMLPVRPDPESDVKTDDRGFQIDESGKRVMKRTQEDWVMYAPSTSPTSMRNTERIRLLDPQNLRNRQGIDDSDQSTGQKMAFFQHRWEAIKPAYEAWRSGHEIPLDGTPLQVWPALRPEHIAQFHLVGIKTVERVATMNDSLCDRVKLPDVRGYRELAKAFLANMETSAAAEREAAAEERLSSMQEQLDAAMQIIADLQAAGRPIPGEAATGQTEPGTPASEAQKRRPGRPSKASQQAAA